MEVGGGGGEEGGIKLRWVGGGGGRGVREGGARQSHRGQGVKGVV